MNRRGGVGTPNNRHDKNGISSPNSGNGVSTNSSSSSSSSPRTSGGASSTVFIYIVLVGIILVWQGTRQIPVSDSISTTLTSLQSAAGEALDPSFMPLSSPPKQPRVGWNSANPLDIPQGEAPALAMDTSKSTATPALLDWMSLSPTVWSHMISDFGIHSVMDIGCGLGATTSWFATHGVKTLCVDAVPPSKTSQLLATSSDNLRIVEHDYTQGPWWPQDTYDAAWGVEFLEHVSLEHQFNYIATFRKAALIFVTSSRTGGGGTGQTNFYANNHVEVHDDDWWITKYELYGLRYSEKLTQHVRTWAKEERDAKIPRPGAASGSTDQFYDARHVWLTMKVFVNPTVAALPQHAHLFFEHGCHAPGGGASTSKHRPCGTGATQEHGEVAVASHLLPLPLNKNQYQDWTNRMTRLVVGVGKVASVAAPPPAANQQEDEAALAAAAQAGLAPRPAPPAVVVDDSTTTTNTTLKRFVPEIITRIRQSNFTNLPIVPVVAWPYVHYGVNSAEHKHIEENGINESQYLRLSMDIYDFDENMVWIGDTGWGWGWKVWCQEFFKVIQNATERRIEQNLPTTWPIYIVDFTDHASFQRCPQIEALMGRDMVQYSTRSMAIQRRWMKDQNWVKVGSRINTTLADGTFYQHTPLIVRTDTIESLQTVLQARNMTLVSDISRVERTTDVTHLWPLDLVGVNPIYSELRLEVSKIVDQMGKDHNLNNFVGIKGEAIRTGRRGVKNEYIEALLDTKIMVVTQRDSWEDHYRLMEALISGACVFSDFMYGVPAGLQNGTSIIYFTSAEDLKNQILYYLAHDEERIAIGREGRRIAMTRHRTWHRIEEIIFGRILSTCEAAAAKNSNTACPWIVHGNEARRRRRRRR